MSSVDRHSEAVRQLPAAHSLAIRLREAGVPDELIADCLGIDTVAVGPLLVVAEEKLKAILRRTTFG